MCLVPTRHICQCIISYIHTTMFECKPEEEARGGGETRATIVMIIAVSITTSSISTAYC